MFINPHNKNYNLPTLDIYYKYGEKQSFYKKICTPYIIYIFLIIVPNC